MLSLSGTPPLLDLRGFPLTYLPPEITTEIFLRVCGRQLTVEHPRHRAQEMTPTCPLFLGKICKEWRNIAWSCPLLWNVLHIPLNLHRYTTQLKLLEEWIDRTSDCPLSIYLDIQDSEELRRGTDLLHGMFSLLVKHSRRWENVDIVLPPHHAKGVLNEACLRVPLLRSASIHALNSTVGQLDFLESSPNLRELELKRISPIGVDCQNLTRLVASFISTSDVIVTLRQTKNLEYLYLRNTVKRLPDNSGLVDPVFLPSLKTLRLRDCHLLVLLPYIGLAPMLQELKISEWGGRFSGPFDLDLLRLFLNGTQCRLQSLGLCTEARIYPNILYHFLKDLDCLDALKLRYDHVADDLHFFRAFVNMLDPYYDDEHAGATPQQSGNKPEDGTVDVFLPNLRYLGYQTPLNMENNDFLKLIQVLKSRWFIGERKREQNGNARGKLRIIQFDPFMHPYAVSNLDALREEMGRGLKVMFDLPFVYSQDNDE